MSLPKSYTPKDYEDDIYKKWEKSGYFNPDNLDVSKDAPSFTISMPPPNATGQLHVGHTLGIALQDIMVRYHRMKGDRTLWLPGVDHAAIATQNVVEKILKKEKNSRHKLGREKFLKRVEQYVKDSKSIIENQTRKMGASCDWSRESYTMSDELSHAVKMQFKDMYEDGLIYRGNRIINWCPRCHSTLADDEVEHQPTKSKLYWIKYGPFVLATTRPETKLGDTAVAVHPSDERYKDKVGKKFMIPGVLGEFEVEVIADHTVDQEFGSGAVKVTPSHSFADAQMAEKHNIPGKQIINEDGRMMDNCGKYAGMKTLEAREAILKDMTDMGLIDYIDDNYEHNLSVCYRCKTAIEPLPSLQWFIAVDKEFKLTNDYLIKKFGKDTTSLKEISKWAVESGEIEIVPERFKKIYYQWMDNLHDWCISRQIWFGHRIPVWYKKNDQGLDITYFIHGTTTDNEKNLHTGQLDGELSELGKKQNQELKEALQKRGDKYDVVFCSDLARAKETAETLFERSNVKIITDKRLRECNYGVLNGHPDKDFKSDGKYYINNSHPNGESCHDVEKRIREFLEEISKKYKGKKIAVMAHKYSQLALEVIINDKTWEVAFDTDWRNTKNWQPGWNYNYRKQDDQIYVGLKAPEGDGWVQDEDTLDTWFSSALWTWSTLLSKDYKKFDNLNDWANNSPDLQAFHPTSVMETMHDILFFWVARMVMMTLYSFNKVPFNTVYLHSMVCDKHGKKMSKSKPETCIEPIEVSEKYGTDALRLSLIIGNTAGNPLRLSEQKIASFRNFANKLWNIGRFIEMMGENLSIKNKDIQSDCKPRTLADRWILSRLNSLIDEVTEDLEKYRFSLAGEKLYNFTWHELADWYVEIAKYQNDKNTYNLLLIIYSSLLKLLHPFTPYVTETIWQFINPDSMLIIQKWPESDNKKIDPQSMQDFGLIQELVTSIRSFRKDSNIDNKKVINLQIAGAHELIEDQMPVLRHLAKAEVEIIEALVDEDFKVENLKIKVANR